MANKAKRRGAAATGAVVNDDLRRRIAEALLFGEEPDRVAQRVAGQGVPFALATQEVDRAQASPYFRASQRLAARLAKRDWLLDNYTRLAAAEPGWRGVPRRDRLDPESFFADHYSTNRPVLIGGLIDAWPAMKLWTLDYLERFADAGVDVQWGRESDAGYELNKGAHTHTMPFGRVIERLRDPEPTNDFYMTANNDSRNRRALAPLWQDIAPIPGYLNPDPQAGFLWIGPMGTITPFHHDLTNNLLIQIVGRKRVRMVAAHDTPLMKNSRHCFSDWGSELAPGPAAPGRPEVIECVMEAGDALFIPIGWWHHVEGLDQTISMSFTNFARANDHYSNYKSWEAI